MAPLELVANILSFCIANEEISRASASVSAALTHSSLASSLILVPENDEQKAKYPPAVADMASLVEASRLLVYRADSITEPDPISG